MAKKEEAQRRQAICEACPAFMFNFCMECKCFIPMKVSFSKGSCPLGKWEPTTEGDTICSEK